MSVEQQPFRVSTGLKNLIGQELILDDFVAVFELVKNSFDAHAKSVRLTFLENRLIIADDGKGMSRADILSKWLFVAYSAKRLGIEDEDYRGKIGERGRPFAGAKGVGRFSCDRLGSHLLLSSRASGHDVQIVDVDWRRFEGNPNEEFDRIPVDVTTSTDFPDPQVKPGGETGSVLDIGRLRAVWDRARIQGLKRELTKLIDPFSPDTPRFQIEIIAPAEVEADAIDQAYNESRRDVQQARLLVNGPIENHILDVMGKRTTGIHVELVEDGLSIETTLEDRGELIYRIRESNAYPRLSRSGLKADIYFLNRSAKTVFAHRMGLPVVQFGSVFLFRNGFRVYPVGAEDDDFFELNRRKQQGQRRFLGGRDLIGRVEVKGVPGFDEATSRNQGLIKTSEVEDLVAFVREKCVKRLERYVVDISWKDEFDKDSADISRMRLDQSSALVAQLVSRLAASEGVELLEYNTDLVRIVDDKSTAFESSLSALEMLAEQTGEAALLARVKEARDRVRALQISEAEARQAEERAETRAMAAERAASESEAKYSDERRRSEFLVAAASLDHDTVLNLHHQIMIHASDVQHGIKRMMNKLRRAEEIGPQDWTDFLDHIFYRNSQIITAARFATKGGYKQQPAEVEADLSVYVCDYIDSVASLWAPRGVTVTAETDGKEWKRKFRPIEVGTVIDNLVANAVKARSSRVLFSLEVGKGFRAQLLVTVADDGSGWPNVQPLERVLQKGVTTTDGSGLGLYHVKQIIEGMGGSIEALPDHFSEEIDGAHLILRIPAK